MSVASDAASCCLETGCSVTVIDDGIARHRTTTNWSCCTHRCSPEGEGGRREGRGEKAETEERDFGIPAPFNSFSVYSSDA